MSLKYINLIKLSPYNICSLAVIKEDRHTSQRNYVKYYFQSYLMHYVLDELFINLDLVIN